MTVVAVVGSQWGDEGKGKIVDILAERADVVVRFQGGNNAGHTLVVAGERTVFHLVPSGILREGTTCVLGQGMVIDTAVLLEEIDRLEASGHLGRADLVISDRAHLILPHHIVLDRMREGRRTGSVPVGTTLRGIGPAYEDKVGRRGLRAGDLLDEASLRRALEESEAFWGPLLEARGESAPDREATVADLLRAADRIGPMIADATALVHERMDRGERVLLEGAQGAMLDVDHGTYPFVTSSNTVAGAACAGAGIGPTETDGVVAVAKAYATRVGAGPFPTELDGDEGDRLRDAGAEYGSTTGRPRRCGWFDAVAARRAVRVSGARWLALTKLDVLTGLSEVKACVGYEIAGERVGCMPVRGAEEIVPVYRSFPGWSSPLSGARSPDEMPGEARDYVDEIARLVGCEVCLISVGPGREQTMLLRDPLKG